MHTKQSHFIGIVISIVAFCGLLTACGGSTGSSHIPTVAQPVTVSSTGRITGFGSIIMNGEKIETGEASHEQDEESVAGDEDFAKGMIVSIEAEDRDGTLHALSVSYDPELEGPIEGLVRDDDNGTITGEINGIPVLLSNANTHFDDVAFDTIMQGDCLEVDGEKNDRTLIATYVEACDLNEDGDLEREFTAEIFDITNGTYVVGEWQVLTDANTEIEGDPQVGDVVEVECVDTGTERECLAKEIEPQDEFEPRGDRVHLEGFVERIENSTFYIREHQINVGNAVLPDRFSEGVPVRVKGQRANGVITAEKIKIATMAAHVKAQGLVAGFGYDGLSFDLTLFGQPVTFTVDPMITEWDDEDDSVDDRMFDLTQFAVGDFLEVKAEPAENGGYLALRVEREDDEGQDKIMARVDAVDSDLQELNLIGVTIASDLDTRCKFFRGDHDCGRFFDLDNGIMVGHLVKAKGMRMDNIATELKTKRFGEDFGKDDHDVELKGSISGYLQDTMHFMLGEDIEVDASMARLEPRDLLLENGLFVEVEGEWIDGIFKAHVVELENENDEFGEVTGYVESIDDVSICLTLNERQDCVLLVVNEATELEAEIVVGSFVEVEFNDELHALEVGHEDDREIEFKGELDNIQEDSESYAVVALGVEFRTKNTTRYKVDGTEVNAPAFVAAWMENESRTVKLEDKLPHDGFVDELAL